MIEDSKEKILRDWNDAVKNKTLLLGTFTYSDIEDLYRFLKVNSREQGKQSRQEEVKRMEEAKKTPRDKRGKIYKLLMDRSVERLKLSVTLGLEFQRRIKDVKRNNKVD